MNFFKGLLIVVAFIITSSAYAANFSGVYKIIESSCVEDNRQTNELGKKISSLRVLRLLDSSARSFELSYASLNEGKELTIEHSADSLKLKLIYGPDDFVTLNFADSWNLLKGVSLNNSPDEVVVMAHELSFLVQKYGEMEIRKSGNDFEIETTFRFNAMLGGKLDHTVKCRLAKQVSL